LPDNPKLDHSLVVRLCVEHPLTASHKNTVQKFGALKFPLVSLWEKKILYNIGIYEWKSCYILNIYIPFYCTFCLWIERRKSRKQKKKINKHRVLRVPFLYGRRTHTQTQKKMSHDGINYVPPPLLPARTRAYAPDDNSVTSLNQEPAVPDQQYENLAQVHGCTPSPRSGPLDSTPFVDIDLTDTGIAYEDRTGIHHRDSLTPPVMSFQPHSTTVSNVWWKRTFRQFCTVNHKTRSLVAGLTSLFTLWLFYLFRSNDLYPHINLYTDKMLFRQTYIHTMSDIEHFASQVDHVCFNALDVGRTDAHVTFRRAVDDITTRPPESNSWYPIYQEAVAAHKRFYFIHLLNPVVFQPNATYRPSRTGVRPRWVTMKAPKTPCAWLDHDHNAKIQHNSLVVSPETDEYSKEQSLDDLIIRLPAVKDFVRTNTVSAWLNEVVEHVEQFHADDKRNENEKKNHLLYTWSSEVDVHYFSPFHSKWIEASVSKGEAYCLQYFSEILKQNVVCRLEHEEL
jgi:hypothetical protein